MNPEDAKTKWCPFVRLGSLRSGLGSLNRNADSDDAVGTCVADNCMAWRWSLAKETEGYLGLVRQRMVDTGESFAKATQAAYVEHGDSFERAEGYCGLAGTPR